MYGRIGTLLQYKNISAYQRYYDPMFAERQTIPANVCSANINRKNKIPSIYKYTKNNKAAIVSKIKGCNYIGWTSKNVLTKHIKKHGHEFNFNYAYETELIILDFCCNVHKYCIYANIKGCKKLKNGYVFINKNIVIIGVLSRDTLSIISIFNKEYILKK